MTEVIEVPLDPEIQKVRDEWEAGAYNREVALARRQRAEAYAAPGGADEMRRYIDEDEARGVTPRFTIADWLAEKDRVRELFPDPEPPKSK